MITYASKDDAFLILLNCSQIMPEYLPYSLKVATLAPDNE